MAKRDQNRDEPERTWTAVPRVLSSPSEKHAYLLVLSGPQFGSIFPLGSGKEVVLGRREDVDIQIRDDGVSRRHASLRIEGEGGLLTDLDSANGTYVDGKRVTAARVHDGTRIQMGRQSTLKFIWADELEARYQMRLAESAIQDPLTGLHNRRHLEDRLTAELAAAKRYDRPVSLLMVDIDSFKNVNDENGHLAGDELLKMVAFILRGAVRKEDVLVRYGGDEFVVVARETALEGARALAQRIRRAVERSHFVWQGRELGVTVSVGVSVGCGPGGFEQGRTERELLACADRALYLAKQGGRNRVVAVQAGDAAAAG